MPCPAAPGDAHTPALPCPKAALAAAPPLGPHSRGGVGGSAQRPQTPRHRLPFLGRPEALPPTPLSYRGEASPPSGSSPYKTASFFPIPRIESPLSVGGCEPLPRLGDTRPRAAPIPRALHKPWVPLRDGLQPRLRSRHVSPPLRSPIRRFPGCILRAPKAGAFLTARSQV